MTPQPEMERLARAAPSAEPSRPAPIVLGLRTFVVDEAGVTSIEYVLLASLIAVVIVGICTAMFFKLSSEYGEIAAVFS
ncbi:MAG: Flp family type IVb pilin [Roseiarcus sp.]